MSRSIVFVIAVALASIHVLTGSPARADAWVSDVQATSLVLHWNSGHAAWKVCYKESWAATGKCQGEEVFYTSDKSRRITGLKPNTEYKFVVFGKHKKRNKYPHKIAKIRATTTSTQATGGNPVVGDERLWPVEVSDHCITMGWQEPASHYTPVELCYSRARHPLSFWRICHFVTGSTSHEVCSQIESGAFYRFELLGHYVEQKDPSQPPRPKTDQLAKKRVATSGAGKWDGKEPDESSCRWSDWLNRDSPSGVGDFETLKDHHQAGKTCAAPRGIECRVRAGGSTSGAQPYTCDPQVGGVCDNRQLTGGTGCLDYEVRFCC